MDEPVVSNFDNNYYSRGICVIASLLWCCGYMLYNLLIGYFIFSILACLITLVPFSILGLYCYLFSKSWKRITITATEIIVDDVISKKQITIPYTDIHHIGTYGRRSNGMKFTSGFAQSFVIEYKDDLSVRFNEIWYDNYNKLTMSIYLHKYGPGHGRERYEQRHQN